MKRYTYSVTYDIEVICDDEELAMEQVEEMLPIDAKRSRIDLTEEEEVSYYDAIEDCCR